VITYNRYGGEKRGDVLILKKVRLNNNRDYDPTTGELINQLGKVYRQDYFNDEEEVKINTIFLEVRQELVDGIKQNTRLERNLIVFYPDTNEYYEADD
jgi:hypothetical protein